MHTVHVIVLQSQNSSNDQPNDMGNNAQLKAHYSKALRGWKLNNGYRTLEKHVFNYIMVLAWENFVNDPKTAPTARKAFVRARLHPLVDILKEGAVTSIPKDDQ